MSTSRPQTSNHRLRLVWIVLALLLFAVVYIGLVFGTGDLNDPEMGDSYLRLRGYRLANSLLAGAALAVGGVLVQGLFRNPLASPSILGTTAGASLGGVVVLMLWNVLLVSWMPRWLPRELLMPLGCVGGALFALMLLLYITRHSASLVTVLLTGFILSSLFLAVGSLLLSIAQDRFELGRAVVAFTLGGVETKGLVHIAFALPLVALGFGAAFSWSTPLDLMLSGEAEAHSFGVNVPQVRTWIIVWTAILTGAAVAVGGNLAFVGLVVPHALRPYVGVQHRRLFPAALVGGAVFVAWADVLIRLLPLRADIPLGVNTGLIGAPVFLILLKRSSASGAEL